MAEKGFHPPTPICKGAGDTMASPENTSSPASPLRHGAEPDGGLTGNPQCLLLWMGTRASPHHPRLNTQGPRCYGLALWPFPTSLSNLGPILGAPWEGGPDG